MNKKSILFKIGVLTAVFTLNASLYISLSKKPEKVVAYDAASLPTTIDLNDCGEQEIRSYYSGLNSLSASERQGTNLLKNLKPILMNNQKYFSYENGESIWKFYEITDRDWVKSPASAITNGTYNANTNIITGYKYGSSYSNPYLHALYINRNVENQTKAWGDHSQTNWGINREHIWAKSHGFQDEGAGGARGDPMHLWAANGYANNKHSNYFFAFVDKSKSYENCGSTYSYISGNLKGYSKNAGGSQYVFEQQDCDKGDIARSVFYMVARYNNYAGVSSGIGTNNPNLKLVNSLSENSRTGTSTYNDAYGMGLMSDLLAWNKLDPVDAYEIHRNNLLYKNFTNNRNPFIDFPGWADAIWGTANLDGTNYNSNITTYASPSSDSINVIESNTFGISTHSIELEVDDTAEIYGTNADGNISWSVEDSTIVSLNKATTSNNERVTITALKGGTTTITATNGLNSVACTVTVGETINYGTLENPLSVDEAIDLISITGNSETAEPLYVKGIVTSNSAYNTKYYNYDEAWLQNNDGSEEQAFELFRFKLSGVSGDWTAANSMVGKEVVAYGYGKKFNGTPELTTYTGHNPANPLVYEINDPEPTAIELDKASASIEVGETVALTASLIPNNAVATIIWESSDESVATVNNGVVTGVSGGQAIITAKTSEFDLDVECVVTVSGAPSGLIDYINSASSYAKLTAHEEGTPGEVTTITKNISQVSGTTTNGTQVASLTLDSNITISVNNNGNNGKVYSEGAEWRLYQTDAAIVTVSASNSSTISSITFTFTTGNSGTLLYNDSAITSGSPVSINSVSTATFTVSKSGTGSNGQIKVRAISVTYTTGGSVFVDTVSMKYGASISKDNWDAINNLDGYQITDYGVMVFRTTEEHLDEVLSVEQYFNLGPSNVAIVSNGSGIPPTVENGNYDFYVSVNFGSSTNYFNVIYCAAPFIKVNDEYYFLTEQRYSVNSLADYYKTHDGCDLSGDALQYLATAH